MPNNNKNIQNEGITTTIAIELVSQMFFGAYKAGNFLKISKDEFVPPVVGSGTREINLNFEGLSNQEIVEKYTLLTKSPEKWPILCLFCFGIMEYWSGLRFIDKHNILIGSHKSDDRISAGHEIFLGFIIIGDLFMFLIRSMMNLDDDPNPTIVGNWMHNLLRVTQGISMGLYLYKTEEKRYGNYVPVALRLSSLADLDPIERKLAKKGPLYFKVYGGIAALKLLALTGYSISLIKESKA